MTGWDDDVLDAAVASPCGNAQVIVADNKGNLGFYNLIQDSKCVCLFFQEVAGCLFAEFTRGLFVVQKKATARTVADYCTLTFGRHVFSTEGDDFSRPRSSWHFRGRFSQPQC